MRTSTPAQTGRPRKAAPAGITPTDRAESIWAAAVAEVTRDLSSATVATWISPARLLGELEGCVCVKAPPRVADWMRRRFGGPLGDEIRAQGLDGLRIFDEGDAS